MSGHYAAAEEFLVIEGELLMSKVRYRQGDYVVVPPGCLRTDTGTEPGALALARFSGPPEWSQGQSDPAGEVSRVRWPNLPETETRLGLGRQIEVGGIEAWMIEKPLHNIPVPDALAVVSLPDRSLFVLDRGDPLPSPNPPLLVRRRDHAA